MANIEAVKLFQDEANGRSPKLAGHKNQVRK